MDSNSQPSAGEFAGFLVAINSIVWKMKGLLLLMYKTKRK